MSFTAGGAPHDVAISGRHRADLDRLARDLARICQWQCDLFGGAAGSPAPFDRYLFQVAAVGDGYGGLEHRSSTSLLCRRDELPQPGVATVTDDYRRFLGLASHEYFHSWNVKRIKPAAFTPYDLGRENYTRQLWAFEGITSYYDDLALVRSGVIGTSSYLELLGRAITTLLRNPGRHRQSVAESSFDAWIKYYRRDENTPNAVVSYYLKGSLVALALDLVLRTHGASLDAVMRALWERHGRTGTGVPEDGIAAARDGARRPRSLRLLRPPRRRHRGSAARRAARGVRRGAEPARGPGRARRRAAAPARPGGTGAVTLGCDAGAGGEVKLQHVFAGGPAAQAGLSAGDVLVAIDGLRATGAMLDAIRRERRPGDVLAIHAFRRDELIATTLTLAAAPLDTCWLALDDEAGAEAAARRAAWLGEGA